MPTPQLHILAADAVEILIGVVIFVLWILGQLASVIAGKKKKEQKQQRERANPVPTYEETIQQSPFPDPRQQTQQQQRAQQQQQQQRRRRQQQQTPPQQQRRPQFADTAPPVSAPATVQRERAAVTAEQIRTMLRPQTVKHAYVLSEVLGKPKGLQE